MTLCRSLGTSFVMWNWQSITRHEVLTFKEQKKKNISLFFFLRRKIAEEDVVEQRKSPVFWQDN
jgi:hypothetical protein